jgi:hypothetical protein
LRCPLSELICRPDLMGGSFGLFCRVRTCRIKNKLYMGTSYEDVETIGSHLTNQSFVIRRYKYDGTI